MPILSLYRLLSDCRSVQNWKVNWGKIPMSSSSLNPFRTISLIFSAVNCTEVSRASDACGIITSENEESVMCVRSFKGGTELGKKIVSVRRGLFPETREEGTEEEESEDSERPYRVNDP